MGVRIDLESHISAAEGQVSCELHGEVVILDIHRGVYYGLDSVGARIWELLQQQRSVADVRDQLLAEYDVAPERCERDLLRLLEQLAERTLIVRH